VAQQGQFRRDPWNVPGWVLFRHTSNQMQVLDSERGRYYW
jgi:hypothetical protein